MTDISGSHVRPPLEKSRKAPLFHGSQCKTVHGFALVWRCWPPALSKSIFMETAMGISRVFTQVDRVSADICERARAA